MNAKNGFKSEPNADPHRSNADLHPHLSYVELTEWKTKGLCYKCGSPFHPNPNLQCLDRQLRVMLVEEGEENKDGNLVTETDETDAEEEDSECNMLFLGSAVMLNN